MSRIWFQPGRNPQAARRLPSFRRSVPEVERLEPRQLLAALTFFGEDLHLDAKQQPIEAFRQDVHKDADDARTLFLANFNTPQAAISSEVNFDQFPYPQPTPAPVTVNFVQPNIAAPGTIVTGAIFERIGATVGRVTSPSDPNVTDLGRFSIDKLPDHSPNYYEMGAGINRIRFSTPQVAFGFYGTDVGDESQQLVLRLSDGVTEQSVLVPHLVTSPAGISAAAGSVIYFGLIDTDHPFTSVTFASQSE
ncbi:MAG TPA: hypothetical protein VF590_09190, partial [Isosphaeraceae bacterium]